MTSIAAHAQTAEPAGSGTANDPGEIIVTARQRAESLISVPVAVSALSAGDIDRYGATTLQKVAELVPTVIISKTSSGAGGFVSIRGIGTSPSNAGFDQAVSLNVDGVQLSRGRVATQSFFDVRQVEILKGPQALFFGKNSPAGVISLASQGATEQLEGYARVGYEFVADEAIAEGAISGPLTDTLGFRVALRGRKMRGFMRNDAQPSPSPAAAAGDPPLPGPDASRRRGGEREILGRLTLEWKPTDTFDATAKLLRTRYRDDGPSLGGLQVIFCGNQQFPITFGALDRNGDCRADNHTTQGAQNPIVAANWPIYSRKNGQSFAEYDAVLASLTMNLRTDAFTLTSVTGYYDSSSQFGDNFDGTGFAQLAAAEDEHYKAFSQELRFVTSFDGAFNIVAGAYYQDTRLRFMNASKIASVGVDAATGKYHSWERQNGTDGTTYSIFGQGILTFAEDWELAGGLRWTHEKKDSFLVNTYIHPRLAGAFTTARFNPQFSDDNFSPEATLSYHPTSSSTIYAAYKTGYKSGGAGLSATLTRTIREDQIAYGPERVRGFEVGAKGRLLDNRLRAELVAYFYTFSDLQVTAFDPVTTSFTIQNAAKARQKGVELQLDYAATDALRLRTAISYNRNRFKEYPGAQCYAGQTTPAQGCVNGVQNLAGRPTSRSPDWSGNAGFTYDVPLSSGWTLGFTGDAYYSDDYFASETQSPGARQDAFWRFDASVRIASDDDRWELALLGRNLSNKYYLVTASDKPGGGTTGQIYGTVARPREITLQATTRF